MALRLDYAYPGQLAWDPYHAAAYYSLPAGRGDGNGGIIVYGRWNIQTDASEPNPLVGATSLTVALTINPMTLQPNPNVVDGSLVGSPSLVNCWGDVARLKIFRVWYMGAGQLMFQVAGSNSGDYWPVRTVYSDFRVLKEGVWNRILCRWQANPGLMNITVDGVDRTSSAGASGDVIASLNSAAVDWWPISFGGMGGLDEAGVAGDYAEGAIWTAYKSDADARLYGRGASPNLLDATGRCKYVPMTTTEGTPTYEGHTGWQHPVSDLWWQGGYQYGGPADLFTYPQQDYGGMTIPCKGFVNYTPTQPVTRPHPTVYTVAPATWPPVANFTPTQTDFQVDTATFSFTDTSLDASGWDWNFGDGTTHATTQNVSSHVYYDPTETYEVTLTVTGAGGATNALTKWIAPVQPIGAAFAWNQYPGTLTVWFLDCSTGTRSDAATAPTFDWDWGDGTTHGTTVTPQHTYATTGAKTVTLTVTNVTGSASITHTVTVNAVASFIEPMPATDGLLLPQKELELCERSAANLGKRSGVEFICTTYQNLANAFSAARYGDTIKIPPGTIYIDQSLRPSDVRTWTLDDSTPRMPPQASRAPLEGTVTPVGTVTPAGTIAPSASGCDPSYVLVTSTGALPDVPVLRVAVEDNPNYAILGASGRITPPAVPQMATLIPPYGVPHLTFQMNPFYGERRIARWYFRGVNFDPANRSDVIPAGIIVGMGPGAGADGSGVSWGYDNNYLNRPDHIVFQQCMFNTDPHGYGTGGSSFADGWSGSYLGLINCWFDNWIIPAGGGDPKLLFDVSGPGPVSIENNVIRSLSALYFVGGSGSNTLGSITADWTIRRNRFWHPAEWIPSEMNAETIPTVVTLDGTGHLTIGQANTYKGNFQGNSLAPWPGDLMIDRGTGLARPILAVENLDQPNLVQVPTWPAGANRMNLSVVFQRMRADELEISPTVYNSGAVGTAPDASDCPTATVNGTTTVTFSGPLPDAVTTGLYFYLNDTWWPGVRSDSGSPVAYTDATLTASYGANAAALSTTWGYYAGRKGQQYAARKKITAIASNRLSCTLEFPYTHPNGTKTFPYSVVRCNGIYCDSWRHYKGAYENKLGQRFLFEGNVWDDFGARTYNTSQPPTWSALYSWAIARIARHKVTLLTNTWAVHPLYGWESVDEDRFRYGPPAGYSVIVPNGFVNEYTGACRIIVRKTSSTTALLLPPDPANGSQAPDTFVGVVGLITVNTPFSTLDKFVYRYNIAHTGFPNIWIATGSYTHATKPGGHLSYHDNVAIRYGFTANNGAFANELGLHMPEGYPLTSPAWAYGPGGCENWGLPPRRADESLIRWTHNSIVRPHLAQQVRNAIWFGMDGSATYDPANGMYGPLPRKGSSIRLDDNVLSLDESPNLAIIGTTTMLPVADPRVDLDATVVPSGNVFAGSGIPAAAGSGFKSVYPANAFIPDAASVGFTNYQRDPAFDLANYVLTDVVPSGGGRTVIIAANGLSAAIVGDVMPDHVQPGQFFKTTTDSTLKRLTEAGPNFGLTISEAWPTAGQYQNINGNQTWTLTNVRTGCSWQTAVGGQALYASGPTSTDPSPSTARCTTDLGSADMEVTVTLHPDGYYGSSSNAGGQVITRHNGVANSYYFFGAGSDTDRTLRLGVVLAGVVHLYTGADAGTIDRGQTTIAIGLRSVGNVHIAYVNGGEVLRWSDSQLPGGTFGGIVGMAAWPYAQIFSDWSAKGQMSGQILRWGAPAHPEGDGTTPRAFSIGFKNSATDGRDPGADIPTVQAMITGLVENVVSAPSVAITSPTTGTAYFTTSATISLGGTAFDAVGVTSVTWSNDRGGSGTASGMDTWSIANIALQSGANVLTVTAHNAADLVGSDVLTVTYSASQAPTLRTKFRASSKVTV